MFGYQWGDSVPDILTLAKPLANGIPIGATVVSSKVAESLKSGDHGTTYFSAYYIRFGGSPFATFIGSHVISRIGQPEFLQHVIKMGKIIETRAKSLKGVVSVRGRGLLMGIEMDEMIPNGTLVSKCLEKGLLLVSAANQTVRLIPPLVINEKEINEGMDIIESVLKSW